MAGFLAKARLWLTPFWLIAKAVSLYLFGR